MKSKFLLIWLGALIASPVLALSPLPTETTPQYQFCCASGQCSPELAKVQTDIEAKVQPYIEGLAENYLSYIIGTPEQVQASCQACAGEADPNACLSAYYQKTDEALSQTHRFRTHDEMNQITTQYFVGPYNVDSVNYSDALLEYPYIADAIKANEAESFQPYVRPDVEGPCASCRRLTDFSWRLDYARNRLVIVPIYHVLDEGGAHPSWENYTKFYDIELKKDVGFVGLFEPKLWPEVKPKLIAQIMQELQQLEKEQQARDGTSDSLVYPDMQEQMEAWSDDQWNALGLIPVAEGECIANFLVKSDDYEFAPHYAAAYFSDFMIPTSVFAFGLKPQYADDFE